MTTIDQNNVSNTKLDSWFEGMIGTIKVDQLQLQTKTASEEKTKLYHDMIEGRQSELVSNLRNMSSQFFIEELVKEYLTGLNQRGASLNKMAFDLSDARILVWAEINDGDEFSEDALILAEAQVNARFSRHGFHISSTIVESGDDLSVPPHYSLIK